VRTGTSLMGTGWGGDGGRGDGVGTGNISRPWAALSVVLMLHFRRDALPLRASLQPRAAAAFAACTV